MGKSYTSRISSKTYFLAWSISFYPQIWLNYKSGSCNGLSPDFLALNILGFACYATYTCAFFFNEGIRNEYRDHNGGKDVLIDLNDVIFALHALLLTLLTGLQYLYYRSSTYTKHSVALSVTALIAATFTITIAAIQAICGSKWLEFIYILSYVKIGVSLVKYIPQAYLNFLRKSTIGWSISNIALDFTGGVCSIAQLLLDAAIAGNPDGITGNIAKILLGAFSLSFDVFFFLQHWLYSSGGTYEDIAVDENDRQHLTGITS